MDNVLPSSQVISRSRHQVGGSKTSSELRKRLCAILGLNQSVFGAAYRPKLSVMPTASRCVLVDWVRFTRCRRQAPTGRHANPTLKGGSDEEVFWHRPVRARAPPLRRPE